MSRSKKDEEKGTETQAEETTQGDLGTITISVSPRVAELGQQQLAVTGVEMLRKPAGIPVEARLGRKKGTVSLVVEARSQQGKELTLVLADTHACWVQHQPSPEAREQLAELWKHLASGNGTRKKVSLTVTAVLAQPNGGETLEELSW